MFCVRFIKPQFYTRLLSSTLFTSTRFIFHQPRYFTICTPPRTPANPPGTPTFYIMKTAAERTVCPIKTAACLIIGDEVLGGKTKDTNSTFLARWCFDLGIELKRIEVIGDEEDEIIEAVSRMSNNYDFVVTSGGIGPTHDDITYQSIAKAFNLPLTLHEPTYERMRRLMKPHPSQPNFDWSVPSPARTARERMVLLPLDITRPDKDQLIFIFDDLWVPVTVVNGNVHILPGIPQLFEQLITGLTEKIGSRVMTKETYRILISTPMSESAVATYLTELAAKVASKGVKVGSYPRFGKSRNTVTLVGRDQEYLESLIPEVMENVRGRRVKVEGEDDDKTTDSEDIV